jgi:hypothetical protein
MIKHVMRKLMAVVLSKRPLLQSVPAKGWSTLGLGSKNLCVVQDYHISASILCKKNVGFFEM